MNTKYDTIRLGRGLNTMRNTVTTLTDSKVGKILLLIFVYK